MYIQGRPGQGIMQVWYRLGGSKQHLTMCQVRVKGCESGSRVRVWFVYNESGRRGRVGLGQAEGKLIRFNDRGGKH